MNDSASSAATSKWILLAGCLILAIGMIGGGYLLGDGLRRAHVADRSVLVRGLDERDVTADLATWNIAYSATGTDLASVRTQAEQSTAALKAYFTGLGFPDDALSATGTAVNQFMNNGQKTVTITQRMLLRTQDIARAQKAVANQFDLVRAGVTINDGSAMAYSFTKLNAIKPAMVAAATKNAREAAEQFAKDSGTGVGSIKNATQGYFSIAARDGSGGGYGSADTPYKKVRVVTTVSFYLE